MTSEVSWLRIDEVIEDIIDRRGITPLKLGGDFVESGHRVISAKLIKDGRIDLGADAPRFVDASVYTKWMKTPLRAGDVIMTSEAPLGELAYLNRDKDWCLGQRLFALRPHQGIIDGRFLYYALQTGQVRADVLGRATGTTVQGIRQVELRKVKIPVPALPAQLYASNILGALDDRITLLRETNATLEEIAQTLFKSWFVDFDPVRAKQEGREPEGMDAETAALFPNSFEESKLGLVPKGWSIGTIDQATAMIIDYRGKTPKKLGRDWSRSGIPAVSAKNIKRGRLVEKQAMNFVDGELFDLWMKDKLAPGDVLMTSEAPLGELLYLAENHNFCISQRVFAMRANPRNCFSSFLYFSLTSSETQERLRARATGTTVVGIRQSELRKVEMLFPPLLIQKMANEILGPCLLKIEKNEALKETLTTLRDTLLPRLISGQLRLPEAANQVKRAA
ncbi:hypothetical protein SRABI118_04538 [Massilia sp. Bi118]|uniref:restriction endonuclease subunit S n=1 Tax=Massilia sp. Bi118 TaxID=2822346 RepID=UPI001D5F50EB|nr:restriction endonuclease subunit S [Massilia sp. Bi118]CAH0304798.1 hypothetical protein SRABI118_04538 [Massilia sp. Bi118]